MKQTLTTGLALALVPMRALADPGDGWPEGYDHMMWGGGHGIFGGLMMLVFWGVIIALIVLAVRWLSDTRGGAGSGARPGRREAMDTLRERFAAGEIDEEEYRRRKRVLED